MTNVHNILQRLLQARDSNLMTSLTDEEATFAKFYLNNHQAELHFFINDSGQRKDGEVVMEQHFMARGEPVDIFSMLTEAAMANDALLSLINSAYQFFRSHVPECPDCKQAHTGACHPSSAEWSFKPSEERLLPLNMIQQLALISFLDLSIPAMANAERPMETDILKHLGDIKAKLGKIVLRLEPTPEKSKPLEEQALKFRIYHQFTMYLQRMRLKRDQMIPIQLTTSEQAFYGGVGQILLLLKDHVSKESEDKQFTILGTMIEEVSQFWDKQKNP